MTPESVKFLITCQLLNKNAVNEFFDAIFLLSLHLVHQFRSRLIFIAIKPANRGPESFSIIIPLAVAVKLNHDIIQLMRENDALFIRIILRVPSPTNPASDFFLPVESLLNEEVIILPALGIIVWDGEDWPLNLEFVSASAFQSRFNLPFDVDCRWIIFGVGIFWCAN